MQRQQRAGRLPPPAPLTEPSLPPRITRAGSGFRPYVSGCVGALECASLASPTRGAGFTSPSAGLVTVEVTAQAGTWGSLSGSRAVSRDSAPCLQVGAPQTPSKAAPVCASPPQHPSPCRTQRCFPCSAGRIQGQACRPHGRHALPHAASWEAFGRSLNSCPEPTGPASGTPWALKLREPSPGPLPCRRPGLPPRPRPHWCPLNGCTRPFSMPPDPHPPPRGSQAPRARVRLPLAGSQ